MQSWDNMSQPNNTIVMEYASQLRVLYSKALTKYMDPKYSKFPAAGPYVPFIPIISIIVKKHWKKDADWLLNATIKEVLQNEEIMTIPIEDILKPMTDQRLRLVLIEGEPGIGKSTLAKELVLRWARQSDQLLLNNYVMVIFIQLRFDTYHNATSIDDLFTDTGEVEMKELISNVKKRKGAGILWILDGFDELPNRLRDLREQSVFIQLIKGDILPKSTVIVAGRPLASKPLLKFLENDSKRISLRGFDSEKTLEYARRYFNDSGIVSEFYSYYSGNLVIENMLHNPMNCYIVCTIFISNNKQYPRTMTELYNDYVRVLLKRHLIDVGMIDRHYNMPQYLINESSFNNLELRNTWNNFSLLSEIAHDGVAKQKYIFGRELRNVTKLSMMNTIISFSIFDPDESSSFVHTTLQEYFAAVYLINNPDLEATYNFHKFTRNPSLKVVLTFYVGMLKMINRKVGNETLSTLSHYTSTLAQRKKGDELYLASTLLRCFYEHDSLIYKIGLLPMVYTHKLHSSTFDYYIIGYLVATHNITFAVRLNDPTQCKALNKGLQSHSTVQGNLKITVSPNNNTIPTILEEVINMTSHVPIIMFNFYPIARKRSTPQVKILLYRIISKFESLQKLIIDYILFNSTVLGHPLLNLTQLNELQLMINCSHENDLELLKQLTSPGRPLRILIVKCHKSYGSTDTNILNLIKHQSSLDELRIAPLAHDIRDSTVWHKSNNSLTLSHYFSYMHPFFEFQSSVVSNQSVISSIMEIQLASFTKIIKLYNHSSSSDLEKGLEVYVNITIYSKPVKSELRSFIDANKKTLPLVEMIPTINTVMRCHKIRLNGFMYAIINYILIST